MDALQAVAAATQIVSSMVSAVSALEQATRDLSEAPKKIRVLEELVSDLENLARSVKLKHAHKLHNPQLDRQIQSLNRLIERLHPNLTKARKVMSKSKTKSLAKVVWGSMVGDPLSKLSQLMRDDLNWWLEMQSLSGSIERVILSTAESLPPMLKVNAEQDYPVIKKCDHVRMLLEQEGSNRVILIVGLSGMGKSCLARQVASDPPSRFVHGAVELGFGHWCSRSACYGSRTEYHTRLTKKICRFLVQIGFIEKVTKEMTADLDDVCCLLQAALVAKSILILLDDVWEQDIIERFARLYDNDCRYLVTTRNEAVYEITEAEKVEICKEDIKEISKEILRYHSMLGDEELPPVGDSLLDRCGHHPLTVAVMGKALRKETRSEKWEKAICNLSTYATCAPGPVSYVNEKESENTLTIFGSFEFSLDAMPEQSKRLFIVLAAVSWAEPVPEACLEALWSVLGQENVFPLVVCKLIEGSLLIKMDSHMLYHVHDMVSLYLDDKMIYASQVLLESSPNSAAIIAPWLRIFGKEYVQMVAEEKMTSFFTVVHDRQAIITLETISQALMATQSFSELEASRKSFSRLLGPRVAELISACSPVMTVAAAKAITIIFTQEDYCDFVHSLEETGAIDELTKLLNECNDLPTEAIISNVVAKFAECGGPRTIDKVLSSVPMNRLAELLAPDAEEWHESVFATLLSLTMAGKSKAVEMMISSGIDKMLLMLLESGSEVAQHHALVTLKMFHELGGPHGKSCIQPGNLNLLPWHARFSLERFVLSDRSIHSSPKPQSFEDILAKLLDGEKVMEAMQDLIPIVEKAVGPRIRDMILQSRLVEKLAFLLQHGDAERNRSRSESAFILMKLACAGGEPVIRKYLELDIVPQLFNMMQSSNEELQESAYTTLRQIVFGSGGTLVLNRVLQTGLLERLVGYLDSKYLKTKEMSMLFLVDLVEVGAKSCIGRMISLQVVEKLVQVEKLGGNFSGAIQKFLKGLDMCKNLTAAERQVMKQQVVRKVRAVVKSHKLDSNMLDTVEASFSQGSRGASSSKQKK